MKQLITIASILLTVSTALAVPAPPIPTGPSEEIVKRIADRRKLLNDFRGISLERMDAEQRAEFDQKILPALAELAHALKHEDAYLYDEAVRDLVNGEYRAFPPDKINPLLLPRLKSPETNLLRMTTQGWVMEYLARKENHQAAQEAIPDLLAMVVNSKINPYLRSKAVESAANIAPGDPKVLKAFIAALDDLTPTNSWGIHDRLAEQLGKMGKSAAPAKKALLKLFERGDAYQDPTYLALGKIERDEKPRELEVYLKRLTTLDSIPTEQAAAAFLHLVELAKTGKKRYVDNPPREEEIISVEVARAARPILLKVVEDRPDDAHSRAALRALEDLGAGSSPQTAKFLAGLLVKYRKTFQAAQEEMIKAAPGPDREAKEKALYLVYAHSRDTLLLNAMAKLEPTKPEAAVPIAEAFALIAVDRENWNVAERLAKILTRFGKGAAPAVPAVIQAIKALPLGKERNAYHEVFAEYLAVLAAAGGEQPGVRQLVIELLDPAGEFLKKSGLQAAELQVNLLLTLAQIGLPLEEKERKVAMDRLQEGLASVQTVIFSAATKVVASSAKTLTLEEAIPLVKSIALVLDAKFHFRELPENEVRYLSWYMSNEDQHLLGQGLALRALGELGPKSRGAEEAVKALARQELQERSDYLPEPKINSVIREARKALQQIEEKK